MKISKMLSVWLLMTLVISYSCEKDKDEAPQLPPMSSFSIDVEEFSETKKSTPTYTNFFAAALAVNYWNTVLAAYMIVPVASYAEALKHEAILVEENTWRWSYNVTVRDTIYTAELFAFVRDDSVDVEMHVSKTGGFQDFIWFDGSFDEDRTGGKWTIYNSPGSPEPWLSVLWDHDWEKETFGIKYTLVLEGHNYEGSYIEYGISEDPVYNAYYILYDAKEDKEYEINLNTETHEGRVYYNSAWHCWAADHSDVECPQS